MPAATSSGSGVFSGTPSAGFLAFRNCDGQVECRAWHITSAVLTNQSTRLDFDEEAESTHKWVTFHALAKGQIGPDDIVPNATHTETAHICSCASMKNTVRFQSESMFKDVRRSLRASTRGVYGEQT